MSLDAIDRRVREEELRKFPLSGLADTSSAGDRPKPDSDHRTSRGFIRSPLNPMPGNIAGQTAVFVEHSQAACVVKSGRTHSRALAPRTELIERTLAANEECEIARLFWPQNHGHHIKSYQSGPAPDPTLVPALEFGADPASRAASRTRRSLERRWAATRDSALSQIQPQAPAFARRRASAARRAGSCLAREARKATASTPRGPRCARRQPGDRILHAAEQQRRRRPHGRYRTAGAADKRTGADAVVSVRSLLDDAYTAHAGGTAASVRDEQRTAVCRDAARRLQLPAFWLPPERLAERDPGADVDDGAVGMPKTEAKSRRSSDRCRLPGFRLARDTLLVGPRDVLDSEPAFESAAWAPYRALDEPPGDPGK